METIESTEKAKKFYPLKNNAFRNMFDNILRFSPITIQIGDKKELKKFDDLSDFEKWLKSKNPNLDPEKILFEAVKND